MSRCCRLENGARTTSVASAAHGPTETANFSRFGFGMEEVGDLSSGDIAWFTVDFAEEGGGRRFRLVRDSIHVTTLERATEGLTGGSPVTVTEFEEGIRSKLAK